ncbi:MAG: aspartyl/glutamyl-tRNA amidotransferase subunit B [Bacteroidetes bacterium RIFCSPLOWO2_02_FULL_36_8]|nr:MAG: aspartyl/glutamyl-tRNA amidotransferase subunit B [Bacteroidetes bacterium RIFCSPLOWO2_02_FULL_36_8]
MENSIDKYQPVIGLEIHAQLSTKSKAFSSDSAEYGELPNSHISAITLAHPGTLPRLNKEVVNFAIKLGLATHSEINKYNIFARKNYFYPDLPKGYQISQHTGPVCSNGSVTIKNKSGVKKQIGLIRIHIEEDAGKSMHDQDPEDSLVDLNRAGVPLLEIVTKPEIYSSEEAHLFLSEMRKLLRYLEICDGNMEEGSMRCDANISIKKKEDEKLGTRMEVENLNSFKNIRSAIEYEIQRQIELIESGNRVKQETRRFDAHSGKTFVLRSKEQADDYRYFPEPDLSPVVISAEWIEQIQRQMPGLPEELYEKYVNQFGLSHYDAVVITETKEIALYFEELVMHTSNYKSAANWVTVTVKSYLNELGIGIHEYPVSPVKIAELINMIDNQLISNHIAEKQIYPLMLTHKEKMPGDIAKEMNLLQTNDTGLLNELVEKAIEKYPEKILEYKNGKKGLLGLFVGEVMKLSKGKAEPKAVNRLVLEKLEGN